MLGGVIILIISTALPLGWVVVAITALDRVRVCSTSLGGVDGALPVLRSAPCFLPGSCEATL